MFPNETPAVYNKMPKKVNNSCNNKRSKRLENKKSRATVIDLNAPEFPIKIPLAYSSREDLESYQLWCSEYAEDILSNLMENEKYRRRVLLCSPQIIHRDDLIKLIKYAAEKEELGRTTVHLAIYLLDVFMDNHFITVDRLNMIAFICLLLASKIEECDSNVPNISSLNEMIANPYNLYEYKVFETGVLGFFKWNILVPTQAHIIETYIQKVVTEDEYEICKRKCRKMRVADAYENYIEMMTGATYKVFEYIDFAVTDRKLAKLLPSEAAAACLAATRKTLNITPIWPEHLQRETKYKLEDLEDHMKIIINLGNSSNEYTKIKSNSISGIDTKSINLSNTDEALNGPEDDIHTIPYKRRCLSY